TSRFSARRVCRDASSTVAPARSVASGEAARASSAGGSQGSSGTASSARAGAAMPSSATPSAHATQRWMLSLAPTRALIFPVPMTCQGSLFSRSRARNATVMLTAASVAIATLPGCAFICSQGPPPPERQARDTYFDCSESWVPAIVDGVLTGTVGLAATSAYNDRTIENPHDAAAVGAGLTALFAASAIYG